jgi:hypothetical protein
MQRLKFPKGYTRTTLQAACSQIESSPDIKPKLLVWLKRMGKWETLADNVVEGLCTSCSRSDRSLCGLLLKGIFKLDDEEYESVRQSFQKSYGGDGSGIYKANGIENAFALVIQLPDKVAFDKRIIGAGGAALAALAVGVGAYKKGSSDAVVENLAEQKALVKNLQEQIELLKQKELSQNLPLDHEKLARELAAQTALVQQLQAQQAEELHGVKEQHRDEEKEPSNCQQPWPKEVKGILRGADIQGQYDLIVNQGTDDPVADPVAFQDDGKNINRLLLRAQISTSTVAQSLVELCMEQALLARAVKTISVIGVKPFDVLSMKEGTLYANSVFNLKQVNASVVNLDVTKENRIAQHVKDYKLPFEIRFRVLTITYAKTQITRDQLERYTDQADTVCIIVREGNKTFEKNNVLLQGNDKKNTDLFLDLLLKNILPQWLAKENFRTIYFKEKAGVVMNGSVGNLKVGPPPYLQVA